MAGGLAQHRGQRNHLRVHSQRQKQVADAHAAGFEQQAHRVAQAVDVALGARLHRAHEQAQVNCGTKGKILPGVQALGGQRGDEGLAKPIPAGPTQRFERVGGHRLLQQQVVALHRIELLHVAAEHRVFVGVDHHRRWPRNIPATAQASAVRNSKWSRLMSRPSAARRRCNSAPSGLARGSTVTSMWSRSGARSPVASARVVSSRASAVAGSSPCCWPSSCTNGRPGPREKRSASIAVPCCERRADNRRTRLPAGAMRTISASAAANALFEENPCAPGASAAKS